MDKSQEKFERYLEKSIMRNVPNVVDLSFMYDEGKGGEYVGVQITVFKESTDTLMPIIKAWAKSVGLHVETISDFTIHTYCTGTQLPCSVISAFVTESSRKAFAKEMQKGLIDYIAKIRNKNDIYRIIQCIDSGSPFPKRIQFDAMLKVLKEGK